MPCPGSAAQRVIDSLEIAHVPKGLVLQSSEKGPMKGAAHPSLLLKIRGVPFLLT